MEDRIWWEKMIYCSRPGFLKIEFCKQLVHIKHYCFPIDGLAFLAVAINNQSALHQIILGFYECQCYCSNSFFLIRWVKFIWRGTHIETLKQKLPYNQYRKFSGGCTGITIFDVLQCYEIGLLKKLKFYWKHDFLTLPSSWIISHIIYWQHGRLRIYYCCFSCTKRRQLLKCRPFSSS